VRAHSTLDEVDSCAVESSFPRSFQQRQRCRDRSPGVTNLRVVMCPFGDESASWQRNVRISDGGNAGDS
jgi:hypothetical protein